MNKINKINNPVLAYSCAMIHNSTVFSGAK